MAQSARHCLDLSLRCCLTWRILEDSCRSRLQRGCPILTDSKKTKVHRGHIVPWGGMQWRTLEIFSKFTSKRLLSSLFISLIRSYLGRFLWKVNSRGNYTYFHYHTTIKYAWGLNFITECLPQTQVCSLLYTIWQWKVTYSFSRRMTYYCCIWLLFLKEKATDAMSMPAEVLIRWVGMVLNMWAPFFHIRHWDTPSHHQVPLFPTPPWHTLAILIWTWQPRISISSLFYLNLSKSSKRKRNKKDKVHFQ